MAKKTTETPVTPAPEEPKETKMPETTTTTALTTTGNNALALNQALAARLPESYHEAVMLMERPTPVSMMQQVAALPTEWQEKVTALIRRMRPQKQGVHTKGSGFKIAEIRLYQGTGSDPAAAGSPIPGTDDSREDQP